MYEAVSIFRSNALKCLMFIFFLQTSLARSSGLPVLAPRPTDSGFPALSALSVGMSWIFDWDDNIAFMPTDVYIYDKLTGAERVITTQVYAEIRDDLKNGSGKWGRFEVRRGNGTGTFRRFEKGVGTNYFLEDLKKMVEGPEFEKRKGPVWHDMIEALSTDYSARQFFILTARSNPPEEIYEGFKYLLAKGIIKYLPPLENLYSAANPANPSAAKADKFAMHLYRQSMAQVHHTAPEVLGRDGNQDERTHLVGYSDDDWGNFEAILNVSVAGIKAGKWSNVKITLKYTGRDPRGKNMRSVVIKSDATLRPSVEGENRAIRVQMMGCEEPLVQSPKSAA
jgi:hypothetical protein